jgi:acyl-CoA thioesterase-1
MSRASVQRHLNGSRTLFWRERIAAGHIRNPRFAGRATTREFRPGVLVICLSLLLATLIGCAEDNPQLSRLLPDATILAFGDSLTRGTGSSAGEDYPAVLARLTNRPVINAGIPGEISQDGLARLGEILRRRKPALMILCHGGNDMLRKKDHSVTQQNLVSMIELAHQNRTEVLLVGVPKPGLLLGTAKFYADVAKQTGVPAELEIVTRILSKPQFKSDPVHPNGHGYRLMAESIVAALIYAGAL